MLPLLLFFVFATSASARTIKLDNGIGYIMVGENAECVNMPPPVYGSPRICLGPTSNLLIGPLNISQRLDDTIVFSVLGSFAVAVNVDGAISVGQSLVFGGPNSVSVTPQNMHKLYDGIWSVENQVNVVNGLVQTVSLPDSNIGGMYMGLNCFIFRANRRRLFLQVCVSSLRCRMHPLSFSTLARLSPTMASVEILLSEE